MKIWYNENVLYYYQIYISWTCPWWVTTALPFTFSNWNHFNQSVLPQRAGSWPVQCFCHCMDGFKCWHLRNSHFVSSHADTCCLISSWNSTSMSGNRLSWEVMEKNRKWWEMFSTCFYLQYQNKNVQRQCAAHALLKGTTKENNWMHKSVFSRVQILGVKVRLLLLLTGEQVNECTVFFLNNVMWFKSNQ